MEENLETSENESESRKEVGFPEIVKSKKKSFGGLILIILALIIAGFFVYSFISGEETSEKIMNEPTPTSAQDVEPSPTEAPKEVGKAELKVSILNGSGTPGVASDLKKKIEALGFKNIETGNADRYDYTSTEVSFGSSVSESVQEEVIAELKKTYEKVDSESKSVSGFDIQIVIGSKNTKTTSVTPTKGASPTPTRTTSVTPTRAVTPTE